MLKDLWHKDLTAVETEQYANRIKEHCAKVQSLFRHASHFLIMHRMIQRQHRASLESMFNKDFKSKSFKSKATDKKGLNDTKYFMKNLDKIYICLDGKNNFVFIDPGMSSLKMIDV